MHILVFSDSHRARHEMLEAVEKERPTLVIHLGDHCWDARDLALTFPQLALVTVPGNCDGRDGDEPLQKLITVEGTRILLSHGHIWEVKRGYERAITAARQAGADVLLFGHTHRPYCRQHDSLWVLNPGPSPEGYGVIQRKAGKLWCSLVCLD